MTNYEKIMSGMTTEEMTNIFYVAYYYQCTKCPVEKCESAKTCRENIREWLESEAETE